MSRAATSRKTPFALFSAVVCATALAAAPAPVAAQAVTGSLGVGGGPPRPAVAGGKRLSAVRTATPPDLDGALDDAVWRDAVRVTEFVQRNPIEGEPATEETEVYLAYDNSNLYVAVYAHYSDLGLIRANRSDRDQLERDDTFNLYFDPFMDQQRAYVFTVNGYGVQGDGLMSSGGGGGGGRGGRGGGGGFGGSGLPNADASWDALFDSAGRLVADGWVAEIAIPFKSLRYPARSEDEVHQWGFQMARTIQSKNESIVWSPTTRAISGFMTQMGTLDGMSNLSTSRNLEFLPTVTAVQVGALDAQAGGFVEGDVRPEAGVGIKYGVTSDLIADVTVNPDFSQIESDQPQIEVNQRFPLFYDELRPFFLEGQEIFASQGEVNLVHTRTIIDPRFGGKLTGKAGPMTLGVLVADDEAAGRVDDPLDPRYDNVATTFVGRLRYDFSPGSYVGAILTDREFTGTYSRVAGVDAKFRIDQQKDLDLRFVTSSTRDLIGDRSGNTYDLRFRHQGRNLDYRIQHESVEPGFWTATGFVRRVETRRTTGNVQYRWWPEHWLINWGPQFTYSRNYDYAGVLQDEEAAGRVQFQFNRNVMINVETSREMERFLGTPFEKWRRQMFARVNTSRLFSIGGGLFWGDQINYSLEPFLGKGLDGRMFLTVLPFPRLASSLNIDYSRLIDPRTDEQVFEVTIFRSETSYQFTGRLSLRAIFEHNTYDGTFDANLLATYRVNAGTVFYIGYDDHYQQANQIEDVFIPGTRYQQTNRAFFAKFAYLFRY